MNISSCIYLREGVEFRRFISDLKFEKLQSLIADPYNQFSLSFPEGIYSSDAGFDNISISCKDLIIPIFITASYIHFCVKKIQNLILEFYEIGQYQLRKTQIGLIIVNQEGDLCQFSSRCSNVL